MSAITWEQWTFKSFDEDLAFVENFMAPVKGPYEMMKIHLAGVFQTASMPTYLEIEVFGGE